MKLNTRLPPTLLGILGAAATFSLYSLVVVFTTPHLSPELSLAIAMRMNTLIVIGIPLGIGFQAYLAANLKRNGCQVRGKASAFGGQASGSALSAFFSSFGLTQVGCCTLWLYYLSLLPGVIGVAAAGFFVRYSVILSDLSLGLVWIPVFYTLTRIISVKSESRNLRGVMKFLGVRSCFSSVPTGGRLLVRRISDVNDLLFSFRICQRIQLNRIDGRLREFHVQSLIVMIRTLRKSPRAPGAYANIFFH
jgi:hypothetical protein